MLCRTLVTCAGVLLAYAHVQHDVWPALLVGALLTVWVTWMVLDSLKLTITCTIEREAPPVQARQDGLTETLREIQALPTTQEKET